MSDPNQLLLQQMGEVQGQLKLMTQMIQQNHDSTHQRINDFRQAVEGRVAGVEKRVETLEKNERTTALKSASGSALMLAAVEAIKFVAGIIK